MGATRSPFHIGEKRVQERLGVADEIEAFARKVVRDYLPEQHRDFYRNLPFLVLGSVDETGQPWASLVSGDPGFVGSPDDRRLAVRASPISGDPLKRNLQPDAEIGILGIQLETRRRNRATGRIAGIDDLGFEIAIDQSFGNCPQYIQTRVVQYRPPLGLARSPKATCRSDRLSEKSKAIVASADTFFIATAYTDGDENWAHGTDVSHRGGKPGFVRVTDDGSLEFPDFRGNNHFNTIGNIELNPKVGLLFPDFATNDLLFVAGQAEITWSGPEVAAFQGAQRLVRVVVTSTILLENVLPLTFDFDAYSPSLDATGSWEEAAATLTAAKHRDIYSAYEVFDVRRESDNINSYYLRRADGGALPIHEPGQFLPIRLLDPKADTALVRTYTISNAPNGEFYRLSIKREGGDATVSPYFHDRVNKGFQLEALPPRGKFKLDTSSDRPVVLLSAGVGITPMIAMTDAIVADFERSGDFRPTYFIHGTQSGATHAFAEYVLQVADDYEPFETHVRYSRPDAQDELGITHDSKGHIDIDLLHRMLPTVDCEYYLCGPANFMRSLFEDLIAIGADPERIHYESFGPASLITPSRLSSKGTKVASSDAKPVAVEFSKSKIKVMWNPADGTLLDLAETAGIHAPFSCRSGICGSCVTKLACGVVDYLEEPTNIHASDEVLICCSIPREPTGDGSCGKGVGVKLEL